MEMQVIAEGFDGFRKDLGFFPRRERMIYVPTYERKQPSYHPELHPLAIPGPVMTSRKRAFVFEKWLSDVPAIALFKELE